MTCLLMFPNRIDAATLSGGGWQNLAPIQNVQDRVIKKVARSTDATLAKTQFVIALDQARSIKALVLINHNLSAASTYRVTAYSDAGLTALVYDSGFVSTYPAVYSPDSLEWESDSFWSGQVAAEDLQGLTQTAILVLPVSAFARYWKYEISDTTNTAGYVQIGRVFLSGEWQPSHNYSYGASFGIETATSVLTSLSGTEYFDRRDPIRTARFSLDYLDEAEAFAQGFDLMRKAGVDKEVMWIADPNDAVNLQRRSFLGRLRTLNPLEQSTYLLSNLSFEIKELI